MTIARIAAVLIFALAAFPSGVRAAITFDFTPNDTVSVAEGAADSASVTIDDTATNEPPTALYVDTTGFCSARIDTVRIQGSNYGARITFFISPGNFDSGNNYVMRITAYDLNHVRADSRLWINVPNTPRNPVFLNLPGTVAVREGQSDNFQPLANDPDLDIRRYRLLPGAVSWIRIDTSSGTITVGPVPDTVANWQDSIRTRGASVVVEDWTGRADTGSFTVNVTNLDRPPQFMNPARDSVLTVAQGVPGSLIFRVIDPDSLEGDSPTVSDIDDIEALPGWQINFSSLLLTFTPPLNFEGLASPVGFRFVAARQSGGPADTVRINFNVLDNVAPGTVTSFGGDSTGMAFGAIRLTWSAPHEDGNAGGAVDHYVIRYSSSDPGANPDAWWSTAQAISEQSPDPADPGILESLIVSELREYRSYWFGIKGVDASGNVSPLAMTGIERSRQLAPTINFLGAVPDIVRADSVLHFEGVAADSGGTVASVIFDSLGTWRAVTIDSTRDQSDLFVRKYFHFAQSAGANDTLFVRVRAQDSIATTTIQRLVAVDGTRPSRPVVQVQSGQDSVTTNNSFQFAGTKDRDASIWLVLTLGSNAGPPIRITQPDDHRTDWDYSEVVYYQGAVSFAFYATDPAGNSSDVSRLNFWLILSSGPINIIDTNSVDYHNSTNFNPQTDSFYVSFSFPYISQFSMSVVNRQGSIIYSRTDSLAPAPGTHQASWSGMMNRGPDAGSRAPDGIYLARFSARVYPVSIYDIPIEVELVLDSYAPYEVDFFPRCGGGSEQARKINSQTHLYLTVGDTGAVGFDTRSDMMDPYLAYGQGNRLVFGHGDTTEGVWNIDLAALPALPAGSYPMTLVVSDAAGNENRYEKFFEVTSEAEVTGFLNYPNPFAPSEEQTRIAYVLGRPVNDLTLEIFDSAGDLVFRRDLDGPFRTPAAHEFAWDGKSLWGKTLNNGVYFARLTGDIETDFHKIAIADR